MTVNGYASTLLVTVPAKELPVALPPPEPKSKLPAETLPCGTGLPELLDDVGGVEVTGVEVTGVEVTDVDYELLIWLLQGFQLVITQSLEELLVELELVELVVDVLVTAAVLPTGTRQTLPVTPAFLQAVASFTNSRYSVAEALRLIVATIPTPDIKQPK